MDMLAMAVAVAMGCYGVAGLMVGLAFVARGISAVQTAPVTFGARVLLLPAAAALWPLVLSRWLQSRRPR
jgi:hypothetical protein